MGSREVLRRLLEICDAGQPYTTLRDLQERTGCGSTSTVSKAISGSKILKEWKARSPTRNRKPRAASLTRFIAENTAQATEGDPSGVLTEEIIDNVMHRLIEEAEPDEKARLNGMNQDERHELVHTFYQQHLDKELSPLEDDVPGERQRKVIQHKRV